MNAEEVRAVRERLEDFAADVFESSSRRDQRDKGATYLRGLPPGERRTSMHPVAEHLGVDHQGLQQFVSSSTWDIAPVRARLAQRAVHVVAPDAWVIDDTGLPKDGGLPRACPAPSSVPEPLCAQFLHLTDIAEPAGPDTHPLGCQRPRLPDAIVFDHLIAALVFGAYYERFADEQISATTMRRRRDEWIHAGLFVDLPSLAVAAYDATIALDLDDVAVDGCITKAPC